MKKPRVLFLFLSISLFADTSPAQVRAGVDVGSHVSTSRLLQQVRELVALGNRGGGTQSGDKCAAYVARRFKEAGYKPAIIKDPQRLAFTLKSWNLKVLEPHSLKHLIRNEWVGAYSPTVRDTSAHLIYVKDPEKLVPGVARGNALLIDNPPAPREYSDLVKKGIRCLLLASPELEGAYSDWAMISDLPTSAKNPIPMFNLSSGNAKALREALADSEDVNIQFAVSAETDSARPKTVTATLEGESSKYYLVCGHGDSDSGGPGADDNASGVSGVLETARVLKALVAAHKLPKPKFSIRFIVWGTEIFSTENYVRLNKDSLKNILGVLNFDEIGTGATRNCLYFESNDVKQNEPLLRLLDSIGVAHAGKRGYWEESTTNPSQGGTDSYVFLSESLRRLRVPDVKIPSVTIYTGAWNELKPLPQTPGWNSKAWKGPRDTVYVDFSAYYHSSLDIPDRTTEKEPFNMTGAVKALSIALTRLAW
ncbi:MAG TPA: M28 family peptidase [Bacteroidota bacterium]|nr:M28 family peptidase [Bacteroidota bacterium]